MDITTLLNDPRLSRVAEPLRRLRRSSIRLHLQPSKDEDIALGASKLGGMPDLPVGIEWPLSRLNVPSPSPGFLQAYPDFPTLPEDQTIVLPFMAQFRLRDLTPFDLQRQLPHAGMLYFFYNPIAYYSDTGGRAGMHGLITGYSYSEYDYLTPANWKVVYWPDDLSPLTRATPPTPLPRSLHYQSSIFTFSTEWTLPHVETCYIGDYGSKTGKLVLTEEEWEVYAELRHELRPRPLLQMLGYSDDAQPYAMESGYRPIRETFWQELAPWERLSAQQQQQELEQGRLLLQLDEVNNGMSFGRDGRLFFFIRDQDLRVSTFERAWVQEQ